MKIWLKKLISGQSSRPKQPRKKLQIQYNELKGQFDTQVHLLEQTLSRPDLASSTIQLGKSLLQDINRFEELHLARLTKSRLDTGTDPLVHPADFSVYVLYQLHAYTEEIYHYIKTVEVVDL